MPGMTSRASGAEIKVLSAGAVKRGVAALAEAFHRETGHEVVVTFATAPVLRGKVEEGEDAADIVIAPVPAIEDFEEQGRTVAGTSAVLGRVKAAVVVRDGAPEPDISTTAAFREAILAAESLVYNQASSGLYIEKLMEKLGVAEEVKAKTTRVPTGGAVMKHLANSNAAVEIGFGQIPEILVYKDEGVKLVGPLPEEIGKTTTYAAGLLAGAGAPEPASAFIRYMATPSARETFIATGVEQPPPGSG